MRRVIPLLMAIILAAGCAYAAQELTQKAIEEKYAPDMDWFSAECAMETVIPDGLSEREVEIYRMAYADGHFDALHPAYVEGRYVLNTKTKKFHYTNCYETLLIDSANREHLYEDRDTLIYKGYKPCKKCNP